jgi:hypothetical protein
VLQGVFDEAGVESATCEDVVNVLVESSLDLIILMAENLRQRIAQAELESEHGWKGRKVERKFLNSIYMLY